MRCLMPDTVQTQQIPIAAIRVLNPRTRGKHAHNEVIDSIRRVGLKRPITVAVRGDPVGTAYDLICGQGRMEAYAKLGRTHIPALVVDANEEECLVRSLVENVARRQHNGVELMSDILTLRLRGYSDDAIADKIGVSASWVGKIALLLERGEASLVGAVQSGRLPLSLAVVIACEQDSELQAVLANGYATGLIQPRHMALIRRLLERRVRERSEPRSPPALPLDQVLRTFETQARHHRLELKRAQ
ncbi:plasmid partitioning protein RepB C-terminal domain-containing protein, partial [uncultured Phenylobacterium sp.]|uniref:plasmid partitioning protein RepB C-terminal domain-containing protein n=1 Tax=uncultured Phenylobacterium sp. TaxID=349273 RepID=UPI00345C6BAA